MPWHVVWPVQAVCGGLVWTRTFSWKTEGWSADLADVEADDDAVADRVCALVGLDGSVSLLRGQPGGDDFA